MNRSIINLSGSDARAHAVRGRLGRFCRTSLPAVLLAGVVMGGVATYAVASRDRAHAAAGQIHRRHPGPTFRVGVSPGSETIVAGSAATYRVQIRRRRFHGFIRLRVIGAVAKGAVVSLKPGRTKRSKSLLTIRTSAGMPPGTYVVRLRATRGRTRRTVRVTLIVRAAAHAASSGGGPGAGSGANPGAGSGANPGSPPPSVTPQPFTISGQVADPLTPGTAQPIDLAIANPSSQPLDLTSAVVTISSLNAPQSSGALPCSLSDFEVQQYSGTYPLVIPPSSTLSLQRLGVPASEWPQLTLLNLPSNQDGCQRASLSLSYAGQASPG